MILAALLLLVQTAPAPAPPSEGEDIVVRATLGRTTMLFDKGRDGKLRNCRVMVSSGSQRRDTAACASTPICYEKTAEQVTDCVAMAWVEDRKAGPLGDDKPAVFTVPKLVIPRPILSASAAGPSDPADKSRDSESQRVKLPPLPKAPGGSPIVIVKAGDGQDRDRP